MLDSANGHCLGSVLRTFVVDASPPIMNRIGGSLRASASEYLSKALRRGISMHNNVAPMERSKLNPFEGPG